MPIYGVPLEQVLEQQNQKFPGSKLRHPLLLADAYKYMVRQGKLIVNNAQDLQWRVYFVWLL